MTSKVLYCYHGDRYATEAKFSQASLAEFNPEITIYEVSPTRATKPSVNHHSLDVEEAGKGFEYKVYAITDFNEDAYVFLDTDTIVRGAIENLLAATTENGITGVLDPLIDTFLHIPSLVRPKNWSMQRPHIPELNSGVLGINKSRLPTQFMDTWRMRHRELCEHNSHMARGSVPDQPSLRQAIVDCNVTPFVIGNEFNFRPCYPQTLYRAARIVHIHKDAGTAHVFGAGVDGDITSTFPSGLCIHRQSILNRGLFALRRAFKKY